VIVYYFSEPCVSNVLIRETKIAKNGRCHQCSSVLERHRYISDEEFVELRRAFMNRSLIRNGNIFIQSSPEELTSFRRFLEQHESRPFSAVFDGLNIASSAGDSHTAKHKSLLVREVLYLIRIAY